MAFMLLIGCSEKNKSRDNSTELEKTNIGSTLSQHSLNFKIWLEDTLKSLKLNLSNEQRDIQGLKDFRIKAGDDSLSLEIVKEFTLEIIPHKNIANGPDTKNILSLLRDYEELPRSNFQLSFNVRNYYYPSMVGELIYENLFEVTKLEVNISQWEIINSYSYIRGRLEDKKEIKRANNKDQISYYDFIWEGEKLIKQKRK